MAIFRQTATGSPSSSSPPGGMSARRIPKSACQKSWMLRHPLRERRIHADAKSILFSARAESNGPRFQGTSVVPMRTRSSICTAPWTAVSASQTSCSLERKTSSTPSTTRYPSTMTPTLLARTNSRTVQTRLYQFAAQMAVMAASRSSVEVPWYRPRIMSAVTSLRKTTALSARWNTLGMAARIRDLSSGVHCGTEK